MLSRKTAIIYLAIFALVAIPTLLSQPSGSASAGLSAGFTAPYEHAYHLLIFITIAGVAVYLGMEGLMIVPAVFVLMLLISASIAVHPSAVPALNNVILGAILLYGIAIGSLKSRAWLAGAVGLSLVAYQMGGYYALSLPEFADPLYYIVGVFVSVLFTLGICIALALLFYREAMPYISRYIETHHSAAP